MFSSNCAGNVFSCKSPRSDVVLLCGLLLAKFEIGRELFLKFLHNIFKFTAN